MSVREQAYQMEIRNVELRLTSALADVEASVRRIREIAGDGDDISTSPGRRLAADAAEAVEYLAALAALRKCRHLIDDGDGPE